MTGRLFFGGVPTRMDVDRLMKIEDDPGMSIDYEYIEGVLGVKRGSNRFRSVTNAWRKRLFREKLLMTTAEGGKFHFCTADQAHDLGRKGISKVGRSAGRLRVHVDAVNVADLSLERSAKHQLLRREVLAIHAAAQSGARAIAAPEPVAGRSLRLAAAGAPLSQ